MWTPTRALGRAIWIVGVLVLVGVTSWGVGCADAQFPGIYARLGGPLNAWVMQRHTWASFNLVSPAHSGQPVTFEGSAFRPLPASPLTGLGWDTDGDGQYDDGLAGRASHIFPSGGAFTVGFEASFADGTRVEHRRVVVVNGTPTVAAGSRTVREGGSVQLSGSGTDPEGQVLAYSWDLNGDGAFEVNGSTTSFSALTLDGPTTRTAAFRVCDSAGGCSTSTATVRVTNAPPRVNAGPDRRAKRRARVRFRMRATDPGRDRLRVLWNFGDGRRASGAVVTHRFRRARTYIVRATVIDDDGARATDRVRVRVRKR